MCSDCDRDDMWTAIDEAITQARQEEREAALAEISDARRAIEHSGPALPYAASFLRGYLRALEIVEGHLRQRGEVKP